MSKFWQADSAAFTLSASKHVSIRIMSTPPRTRPSICSRYACLIWSNEYVLNDGSETSGESESDFDVGPTLPATRTLRVDSSATSRANLAPSKAILSANSSQPYSDWEILFALNVLVSMISAPASIYSRWIALITSGRVRFRHSLLPRSSLLQPLKTSLR